MTPISTPSPRPVSRHAPALLCLAVGLAACSAAPPAGQAAPEPATIPPATVTQARGVADALGRDLMGRVSAAMADGGPAKAVAFCADSAQAFTARHRRDGVEVHRTSLRVRNPRNRPDAGEATMLAYLDSLHRAGTLPPEIVRWRAAADGAREVEYLKPIVVLPPCLSCHGERGQLAPGVADLLAVRYPTDAATGYRAGDLRGMIVVRLRP